METTNNGTAEQAALVYRQYDWGDCLEGTKEQLQAHGLAVGRAFPGETGGAKREFNTLDPRGFPARITNLRCQPGIYTAYVTFNHQPPRPGSVSEWTDCESPGVKRRLSIWEDEYRGSPDALIAAGLVLKEQLPGQPGMRKSMVTILADGTIPPRPMPANYIDTKQPIAKRIGTVSTSKVEVCITLADDEAERRQEALRVAIDAWQEQVRAMQRPAKLQPMSPAKWAAHAASQANVRSDVQFQEMLARIVAAAPQVDA